MRRTFGLLCVTLALAAGAAYAETAVAVSSTPFALNLVMRWAHIFSAIFMLGGGLYVYFILMPSAAAALDDAAHAKLRAALRARWAPFIHVFILLFLISGFYNYLMVTRFAHQHQPLYHALFGVKFLLAMLVFALATFLTGSSTLAQRFQANGKVWMLVLVVLGVVVAGLGGVMKYL